jgi:hypothetical protein
MLRRKLGDANAPPIFFRPKNRFLASELQGANKIEIFLLNDYLDGVKKKMKNLRFTGSRIEASESLVDKGNEAL